MRYLIVNADDFGYSQGINKGIIEAHTNGIVTSTSVMVDAIASNEAANLKQYPELSVGLHFVLGSDDARADLTRQVEKFISITGHKPDHLDTHKMRPTDERARTTLAITDPTIKTYFEGKGLTLCNWGQASQNT
jgi:predicted glycoside hydrolase/deacetylase ChbG (UPF0249 family)